MTAVGVAVEPFGIALNVALDGMTTCVEYESPAYMPLIVHVPTFGMLNCTS